MKEYINEALEKYIEKGTYPWHMPGHKRQPIEAVQNVDNISKSRENFWNGVYAHDFTEAKDLDDMHEPETFIADSIAEMKKVYGTFATYMLVNGSTSGLMTAIHATCHRGDVILAARNCHKAVYNAICMLELEPEYIVPDYVDMRWRCDVNQNGEQTITDGMTDASGESNRGTREKMAASSEVNHETEEKAAVNGEDDREVSERTDILGDISPDKVERAINMLITDGRKPRAVIITSPTYEGVMSDIRTIAEIAHRYGIYLIVDEAQGAHLNFMEGHETAMQQGADIVIESLHKTMPALTQTSLLHVMNPKLDERVRRYLQIFQTSSPSYIFMQSMEKAVAFGANNRDEFARYGRRLEAFAGKCDGLRNIRLFRPDASSVKNDEICNACKVFDHDEGRLVFVVRPGTVLESGQKFTGVMLAEILADRYGLIVEMASVSYVICISSVVDSADSYDILFNAVAEIDGNLGYEPDKTDRQELDIISGRRSAMPPGTAWDRPAESVPIEGAAGKVSGAFVYAYPPGIPVLAPGEVVDRQTVNGIKSMIDSGLNVAGVNDGYIKVLCGE
ncbi:aminotransferase class I/II-fold pyridoxal phosphate-dependent enzyme [Coprococcus sp. AF19-8AC]|uniref:aminotransferase class I/II-fold pyridoxal phosphate-dependent enzyme n=1 Tax=Coprococcus sp. AF19-8AC TaxID=2293090 RepID=UPI0014021B92|nr:DegT/DnrJ/EryC1/StrS family aminotransferase [Coprococcus sp. AF19-8AC]